MLCQHCKNSGATEADCRIGKTVQPRLKSGRSRLDSRAVRLTLSDCRPAPRALPWLSRSGWGVSRARGPRASQSPPPPAQPRWTPWPDPWTRPRWTSCKHKHCSTRYLTLWRLQKIKSKPLFINKFCTSIFDDNDVKTRVAGVANFEISDSGSSSRQIPAPSPSLGAQMKTAFSYLFPLQSFMY